MHLTRSLVIDGEGKHPFHLLQARLNAIVEVSLCHHLCIGVGIKNGSPLFQFFPQLQKVVDLAIIDYHDVSIINRQRLVPCLYVDDGEPAV